MSPARRGELGPVPRWRRRPAYVICNADRAIPPWQQRAMSVHANDVVELNAGHSPFLSKPRQLAAILEEAARRPSSP